MVGLGAVRADDWRLHQGKVRKNSTTIVVDQDVRGIKKPVNNLLVMKIIKSANDLQDLRPT